MEKENEKTGEEQGTAGAGEGDKSETDAKVEQLNADTERIKEAIAENENAKARQMLGGKTTAGQQPVKKPEVDKEQYARDILANKPIDGKKE